MIHTSGVVLSLHITSSPSRSSVLIAGERTQAGDTSRSSAFLPACFQRHDLVVLPREITTVPGISFVVFGFPSLCISPLHSEPLHGCILRVWIHKTGGGKWGLFFSTCCCSGSAVGRHAPFCIYSTTLWTRATSLLVTSLLRAYQMVFITEVNFLKYE